MLQSGFQRTRLEDGSFGRGGLARTGHERSDLKRTRVERREWQLDEAVTGEMVWIPGGAFRMGSDHHYAEEAPSHSVSVDGFWIDRTPVTNRQFRAFVDATGYVTTAEIPLDPNNCACASTGSLVFMPPLQVKNLWDVRQWWSFVNGADGRHPRGPKSCIDELDDHPVVHVSCEDALAYARWAGKDLATEAEWEFAARGGLADEEFAWGNALMPGGRLMANIWQGRFPVENTLEDGYERTSPVRAFPPNGYGLYDMIGNVWEWTSDWWTDGHDADAPKARCIPHNPHGGCEDQSFDPCKPDVHVPRKVLKGGSHLCAPNYSRRYRPAARHAEPVDRSTSEIGFRCVMREGELRDAGHVAG